MSRKAKGLKKVLAIVLSTMVIMMSLPMSAFVGAFAAEYDLETVLETSKLPVVSIYLEGGQALNTSSKVTQNVASVDISNAGDYNISVDGSENATTIKGRGNSSWNMATGKKPYNLKFSDKVNLFGWGKQKSFSLISGWVDSTYMRNYLAYKLGKNVFSNCSAMDCELVDLVVNGEYYGVYLIVEKYGLGGTRIDTKGDGVDGLDSWDGITEYLIEADSRATSNSEPSKFQTDSGVWYVVKDLSSDLDLDPDDDYTSELSYIKDRFNEIEEVITTSDSLEEIGQYIDLDSFIDTYLINELAKNPDFGFGKDGCEIYASTFMYMEEGGKLCYGTIWDFDIAFARQNCNTEAEGNRDTLSSDTFLSKNSRFISHLFENSDFTKMVRERWTEVASGLSTTVSKMLKTTDANLQPSVEMDVAVWGAGNARTADWLTHAGKDYAAELEEMATFLTERISWMNDQFMIDDEYQIYWTRSTEYSPWLTESKDEAVASVQTALETGDNSAIRLYNPNAKNYDEAKKYLTYPEAGEYSAQPWNNPYVLNRGKSFELGVSDFEDVMNDSRMAVAYADPYFKKLKDKADAGLTEEELEAYYTLYNKVTACVQAQAKAGMNVTSGDNIDTYKDLSADEKAMFDGLVAKRYSVLTTAEKAYLEAFESDYNKALENDILYDSTYIWDGGYSPVADESMLSSENVLNERPTEKVDQYDGGVPYYDASVVADIAEGAYIGDLTVLADNNGTKYFYYADSANAGGGYYQAFPSGVYFKYNGTYYVSTATTGLWSFNDAITTTWATEITDTELIASLDAMVAPKPLEQSKVVAFTLSDSAVELDILTNKSTATAYSYDSKYIYLSSITPSMYVDVQSVAYESSDDSVVSVGRVSEEDPYAVKISAKGSGTAVVTCTLTTTDGATVTQTVSVTVNETVSTDRSYDTTYGIYCRGTVRDLGNQDNGTTQLRTGAEEAQGEWATWSNFIKDGNEVQVEHETLRRFTGYVYVSEQDKLNAETFYLSALDDMIIAGDDSFTIYINGRPYARYEIIVGHGSGILYNNYVTDSGESITEEKLTAVVTADTCPSCTLGNTDNEKWDLYSYGGATQMGPWHVHVDSSKIFDCTNYIIGGAVNRIDVIGGDVGEGGGMSRLHLFSSESDKFAGSISTTVKSYLDPECTIPQNEFNVGDTVYYQYTVTNTSDTDVYNVMLEDQTIGIKFGDNSSDTGASEPYYGHYADRGPYGDNVYGTGLNGTTTNGEFTDKTDSLTDAEKSSIDGLSHIAAGETVTIVIAVKKTGDDVTDYGMSIVGKFPGQVTNVVNVTATDTQNELTTSATNTVQFIKYDFEAIKDDYAVIDFGLPITVPVLDNDGVPEELITSVQVNNNGSTHTEEGNIFKEYSPATDTGALSGYGNTADGVYGGVVVENNQVTYNPTAIVDNIDEFTYSVVANNQYATAKLTIVPATSVYYEDSFAAVSKTDQLTASDIATGGLYYTGAWTSSGDATVGTTDTSMKQEYDNDAIYGYDPVYDITNSLYSGGSAHYYGNTEKKYTIGGVEYTIPEAIEAGKLIDVLTLMKEDGYDASVVSYLTFAFAGTGVDIISRCTMDSGTMTLKIYRKSDVTDATIGDDGAITGINPVKSISINNVRTDDIVQDQIPTITIKNLDPDEYVAQLSINNGYALISGATGNIVYVDAIRVYSPLSKTNTAAADKYYNEGEKNTVFYKVRDLILNGTSYDFQQKYFNDGTKVETNGNVVLYIPSKYYLDTVSDAVLEEEELDPDELASYAQFGPKSEIYLKNQYDGFIFDYNAENARTTLQLDIKLIDNAVTNGERLRVTNTATGESKTITVKSLTEMFYDFSDLVSEEGTGRFFVQKVSDTTNIISITNIKIPEQEAAVLTKPSGLTYPTAVEAYGLDDDGVKKTDTVTVRATMTKDLSYDLTDGNFYTGETWRVVTGSEYISIDKYTGEITALKETNGAAVTVEVSIGTNGDPITDTIDIEVTEAPVRVTSVTITSNATVQSANSSTTIGAGSFVLTAVCSPVNATYKDVVWSSANESIATVDENGVVTTHTQGTTVITATAKVGTEGEVVSAQHTVICSPVVITAMNITSNPSTLTVGESAELAYTIEPQNATNKVVTWSAEPSDCVSFSGNKITALKDGKVTVTLSANDESGLTDSFELDIVLPNYSIEIPETDSVTSGEIFSLDMDIISNANLQYLSSQAIYLFSDTENGTYSETHDNFRVLGGNVYANTDSEKTVYVKVKIGDIESNTCGVTIKAADVGTDIMALTINGDAESVEVPIGAESALVLDTFPSVDNPAITWSSSNPLVATVDATGKVTGLAVGKTVVTAKAENGVYDTIIVEVPHTVVESIALVPASSTVNPGESVTYTVTYNPENTTQTKLVWAVYDTAGDEVKGITVEESATGTYVLKTQNSTAPGTYTVKATSAYNSEISAEAALTVNTVAMIGLSISPNPIYVAQGSTAKASTVFNPVNATDRTVTWSINGAGLTIDENGIITAASTVATGEYAITAIAGGMTANAVIQVIEATPESIEISPNASVVEVVAGESVDLDAVIYPANALQTTSWESSATSVATVDAEGNVTVAAGVEVGSKATITATTINGYQDSITVKVISPTYDSVNVYFINETGVDYKYIHSALSNSVGSADPSGKSFTSGDSVNLSTSSWYVAFSTTGSIRSIDTNDYPAFQFGYSNDTLTVTNGAVIWTNFSSGQTACDFTVEWDANRGGFVVTMLPIGSGNTGNSTASYPSPSATSYDVVVTETVNTADGLWSDHETSAVTFTASAEGYTGEYVWTVAPSSEIEIEDLVWTENEDGTLTVKSYVPGELVVRATISNKYQSAFFGDCSVTFNAQNPTLGGVSILEGESVDISTGAYYAINAIPKLINNYSEENVTYSWEVSGMDNSIIVDGNNTNSIKVSSNGIGTATVTVTATAADGTVKTDTITINFTQVTGVEIKSDENPFETGATADLVSSVTWENGISSKNVTYTWSIVSDGTTAPGAKLTSRYATASALTTTGAGTVKVQLVVIAGNVTVTKTKDIVFMDPTITSVTVNPDTITDVYSDYGEKSAVITVDGMFIDGYGLSAKSADETIAKAAIRGGKLYVTGQPAGAGKTVEITVTATKGNSSMSATVTAVIIDAKYMDSIEISPTDDNIDVFAGESVQLSAIITPWDTYGKTVEWSSSDDSVAAVDQTGLVTVNANAVDGQTAVITVKSTDGSNVSDSVTITARTVAAYPETVTVKPEEGRSWWISDTIASNNLGSTPENYVLESGKDYYVALGTTTTWNANFVIATINYDKASGELTITKNTKYKDIYFYESEAVVLTDAYYSLENVDGVIVISGDGSTVTTGAQSATATPEGTVKVPTITGLTVAADKTEIDGDNTDSAVLTATVTAEDGYTGDKTVTWSVSPRSEIIDANITADGVVTASADANGKLIIRATVSDGNRTFVYDTEIDVLASNTIIKSVSLNVPDGDKLINTQYTVTANVKTQADYTGNIGYTWKVNGEVDSSATGNSYVISSDAAGAVTVECTATADDGTYATASETIVFVKPDISAVSIGYTGNTILAQGVASAEITADVTKLYGYDGNVEYSWTVTDGDATLSAVSGATTTVTGTAAGKVTVTVTATAATGTTVTDTITFTVVAIDSVTINADDQIATGSTVKPSATINFTDGGLPEGTEVEYAWSIASGTELATIAGESTANPTITAGDATGTITLSLTVTCGTSSVTAAVKTIEITESSITVTPASGVSLNVGQESAQIAITVVGTTVASVVSAETDIATVNWADGATSFTITGKAHGETEVTVTSADGKTVTIPVTVSAVFTPVTTNVTVNAGSTATVNINATGTTISAVAVDNANANATFSGNVVTIEGVTAGTSVVTVTAASGQTVEINVTVNPVLTLSVSEISISAGKTSDAVTITVLGTTVDSVESDNTNAATVAWTEGSDSFTVTGVAAGDATVTVTAGELTQTVTVTVKEAGAYPETYDLYIDGAYSATSDDGTTLVGKNMSSLAYNTGATQVSDISTSPYYAIITTSNGWIGDTAPYAQLTYDQETGTLTVETWAFTWSGTQGYFKTTDSYFVTWDSANSRFVLSTSGTTTSATMDTTSSGGGDSTEPNPSVSVDLTDVEVNVNGTQTVNISVTDTTVTAVTSDSDSATVSWTEGSASFTITGVSEGSATVTVTTEAGVTATVAVSVTVKEAGSYPETYNLYIDGAYSATSDDGTTLVGTNMSGLAYNTGATQVSDISTSPYYAIITKSNNWIGDTAPYAQLTYDQETGTLTVETWAFTWSGTQGYYKTTDSYYVTWDAANSRFVLSTSGTTTSATMS